LENIDKMKKEAFMRTVRELLEFKGRATIHTIGPDETVFEAVTRMVDLNVGAILVVEDNVIKGILTERDYLRFITERGRTARNTPVNELMTRKVIYVTPDTTLDEAMGIMTEARIRHIPVLSEGRLMGLVSIGDLIKQISNNRKVHIKTLEEYINDRYPGPTAEEAQG
jgi:signal-transduction protein with cAMP-binding, CBS, and nucleotidyltransferase domain